jgi:hypothetical protein
VTSGTDLTWLVFFYFLLFWRGVYELRKDGRLGFWTNTKRQKKVPVHHWFGVWVISGLSNGSGLGFGVRWVNFLSGLGLGLPHRRMLGILPFWGYWDRQFWDLLCRAHRNRVWVIGIPLGAIWHIVGIQRGFYITSLGAAPRMQQP